ncbi:hypothetical protein SLA2020_004350 [Shorea laevis]
MLKKEYFLEGPVIERALVREVIIPTENLVGEIDTKQEIWGYLMGDKVGMIGVFETSGVGKTTIMQHVYNDLKRETKSQIVIWVTVSYPLNVFEVQKNITEAMGVELQAKDQMKRVATLMDIMGREFCANIR